MLGMLRHLPAWDKWLYYEAVLLVFSFSLPKCRMKSRLLKWLAQDHRVQGDTGLLILNSVFQHHTKAASFETPNSILYLVWSLAWSHGRRRTSGHQTHHIRQNALLGSITEPWCLRTYYMTENVDSEASWVKTYTLPGIQVWERRKPSGSQFTLCTMWLEKAALHRVPLS